MSILAIKGGKVVPVTGNVIENGTVLVKDGKIAAVGKDLEIPQDAQVIDAAGKWVTPGLIDAHTHISTVNEPRTIPEMLEDNELSSPITAHIRVLDCLNPHEMGIPEVRKAGFTTCFTHPGGANVIGGLGIALKLREADTVDEIALPEYQHMKMALGENPKIRYGLQKKMPVTRMGVAGLMRETLYNAKVYSDKLLAANGDPGKMPAPDMKLDALVPAIRGEMKCRIHAHRADDMMTAIRIAKEYNLKFAIEHCTEAYKILDYLKENKVELVLGPVNMLPTKMELWGCKLETPGILEKHGIPFTIMADANSGTKYLPTHLGWCMARGLSEEEAFRAMTINAAKIIGMENRVGSLEAGKDADIAIFNGHPFSNFTLCEKTIIDGVVYHNL